jgi:ABC-type amino acid transport substrate-binding protein
LAVLVALIVLAATGCGDDDEARSGGEANVVKVGSTLALAPFEFTDKQGDAQGFEIDILEAVGDKLNLSYEYVKTPFEQAFTGLAAGKYRLNASGIFIRCERIAGTEKVGDFSVPTYADGLAVTVRSADADSVKSLEDLRDKAVGVESKGSAAETLVSAQEDELGIERTEVLPDTAGLMLALEQGRIDAAVQSKLASQYAIRNKRDKLTVAAEVPGTEIPAGFVFKDGDELRARFDGALDELKRDGTLARIYRSWFKVAPEPDSPTARVVPAVTPKTCVD